MSRHGPSYLERVVAAIRGQGEEAAPSVPGAYGNTSPRGQAGDKLRKRFAKAGLRPPRGY